MALKPRQVLEAMNEYYEQYPACAGRSIHKLGQEASAAYSRAREKIARFINASEPAECIWTRNATEALNMVASGLKISKGSKILTTSLEHHSSSLPFVERARRSGMRIEVLRAHNDGTFDIEDWKKAIDRTTRVVSVAHSSNVTGTVTPLRDIVEIAHDRGALVVSDDAQYAPHHPLDVQSLDIDFSAISVHKMCGPTGMGILYGKMELLESLNMFLVGGDTVSDVRFEKGRILPQYLPPPAKFEAGLQNYAGAIGAGAAAEYLQSIGMIEVEKRERELLTIMLKGLKELEHVNVLGPEDVRVRSGLVTFYVDTVTSAHDIASFLSDEYGVMIRSGFHCAGPFHYQLGIPPARGTARASIYIYNNEAEVSRLLEGLHALIVTSSQEETH
ncbi:MAG: selenocysteine lyase [Candidatus Thorarchaeota archaeon]|nr:MAG: selenocysteine lyase [Candidatus Thorarchaeota archaeon]